MLNPKLNIIIPTINRADTLYWTLKTVLEQTYDNFEVIVSDNCSVDNTKEVVNSFSYSNLKYICPTSQLSMSHHWEFVLEHVSEGYVTILGDDDGFLPNSLEKVSKIILEQNAEAVSWKFANFNWSGLPMFFKIPISYIYKKYTLDSASDEIKDLSFYYALLYPSLYGGFIKIDVINRIKKLSGGQFFHSRIPDFYSGAVISANVPFFIRCNFPISINATSRHSTGYSTFNINHEQDAFSKLQSDQINIPFHPSLVFLRCLSVPIAEALLQANKVFPNFPKPNLEKLINEVLQESANCKSKIEMDKLVNGARDIALINYIDLNKFNWSINYNSKYNTYKAKFSPISLFLYLDSQKREINNVYEACKESNKWIPRRYFFVKNKLIEKLFHLISVFRILFYKIK